MNQIASETINVKIFEEMNRLLSQTFRDMAGQTYTKHKAVAIRPLFAISRNFEDALIENMGVDYFFSEFCEDDQDKEYYVPLDVAKKTAVNALSSIEECMRLVKHSNYSFDETFHRNISLIKEKVDMLIRECA